MPILFEKLICDDGDCSGPLDLDGYCMDCGRAVDVEIYEQEKIDEEK